MHQLIQPASAARTLLLALAMAATIAPAPAMAWPFGNEQVEGSGSVTRQARQVKNFSGVAMSVPGTLELRIGSNEGVTIETDDNLQPLIETVVENGVLRVRPARRNLNLRTRSLKIVVTARAIDNLSLQGSGNIEADKLTSRTLQLAVGGSGKIGIRQLDGDAVTVSVGGSGDVEVGGGAVRTATVSVGGSGDVDLGRLAADSARVSIAGSGDVTLWAKTGLSVSIAGSGDVNYYGDPKLSRSVAGSGDARRLGGAPR